MTRELANIFPVFPLTSMESNVFKSYVCLFAVKHIRQNIGL